LRNSQLQTNGIAPRAPHKIPDVAWLGAWAREAGHALSRPGGADVARRRRGDFMTTDFRVSSIQPVDSTLEDRRLLAADEEEDEDEEDDEEDDDDDDDDDEDDEDEDEDEQLDVDD
jgi:hypothetical protein